MPELSHRMVMNHLKIKNRSRGGAMTRAITVYILKLIIHSSCELEDLVETHIRKLCVILRSRVSRVLSPQKGYKSTTPFATTVLLSGSTR